MPRPQSSRCPAAGNDVVAFGFVGDGRGAYRSAPPEGLFVALGVEDRMIRGFDRDTADVLAIDHVPVPVDQGCRRAAESVQQVVQVLAPQIAVAPLARRLRSGHRELGHSYRPCPRPGQTCPTCPVSPEPARHRDAATP